MQRHAVTLPYTVRDDQSDRVTVIAEYMLDAISGWQPATLHSSSSPVSSVATSTTGITYSFVWDSLADLGSGLTSAVIFRIGARDATGTDSGRVCGNFQVDNR
jgi:hypothetical protein